MALHDAFQNPFIHSSTQIICLLFEIILNHTYE